MTVHSMVLTRMAECEEELGREIVDARNRGDIGAGREPGHLTEAARVCRLRGEALRRMAAISKEREARGRGK